MPPDEEELELELETVDDDGLSNSITSEPSTTTTTTTTTTTMHPKQLLVTGGPTAIAAALSKYHPIVIEGMGHYDPRDPTMVAENIFSDLQGHWTKRETPDNSIASFPSIGSSSSSSSSTIKPKLVIVQGDPLRERGISAITPQVTNLLSVPRGLVCLDEEMADYHAANADRDNVTMEFRYSDLVQVLDDQRPGIMQAIEERIDRYLDDKNNQRRALNKPPLKDYFRDFALLQEVTKAACRQVCGELTVAHTQSHISEFSVTSFYKVGLELGLVDEGTDMVYYGVEESFDFDLIDKR